MKTLPLILFVSVIAAGCATTTSKQGASASYPVAYQQALLEFDGAGEVDEAVIDEFVDFLSNLGADDTAERAAELYAEDLYFSDALMLSDSKAAVVKHFRGLVEGGASVEVEMLDVLVQDTDIYLVWLMTASFQPIRKTVTSKTIGITHARFDAAGKVVLHQDFWDTGLGFYQQVPALGNVIKSINRRFEAEDLTQ
ncbi:MAG: nuclear transport factor 2 family protein [Pseudomonadales bacterium]|nr:nuclear transport factor 2 family protein [Pseudomonadales bacterium]